jgi:FAD/FMN-containing dehydrogenase
VIPAARVSDLLREVAGPSVIQESPYPVVAPRTIDIIPRLLGIARAENFRVMFLGTGSSFPADFTLLRDNVVAITTGELSGIQRLSPFTCRVLAGTPVTGISDGGQNSRSRTVGGVIASAPVPASDPVLRGLWSRVKRLEVLTAAGGVRLFCAPAMAYSDDPAIANCFVGSRGRLGLITAIEVMLPLPLLQAESAPETDAQQASLAPDEIVKREVIEALLDPEGLFKW